MMKFARKLCSLLLAVMMVMTACPVQAVTITVPINEANFPDANFRAVVSTFDKNGDEQLDDAEIAAVTEIDCKEKNISSLKGIGCFTALTYLACVGNQLTALDVSKNTALKWLFCRDNQLTALDVSNNMALTTLVCDKNQLTTLDVSNNAALEWLHCSENQLTALDVSKNTALKELYCGDNRLTTLDVSNNTALMTLWCHRNQLTTLDVSNNMALTTLWCYNNNLTTLDVSRNTALEWLYCTNNRLTTLDVSRNMALERLYSHENQLTTLDVSRNTALTVLNCSKNQLTALDVSKNTALTNLDCGGNQLTALDVSNNTALTNLGCGGNQLTTLDVSKNTALKGLDCYNNQLTTLDVSRNMALTSLGCDGNQLTNLDVSKNTALTNLSCTVNQLTTLDVSKNTSLEWLYCISNRLTALDVSNNTALKELHCDINQLTALDVSKNTALTKLECESNSYDITLNANRSYDLSKLPGSFDVSKAKAWNGCTIQGSVIKVNAGVNKVSYTYDCGNGRTMPVTLNVVGVEAPTGYTVTYNANGGSGAPSAQTKTKDVSLTLSTTRPTREGYSFLGWATSASATSAQYQPGSTYTANANATLYAVWEELNTIAINAANFPDANFRAVVSTFDKNGDGKLNEAEIAAVTEIDCSGKNISSLNGIECFTALTYLDCNGNQLTTLDVSNNTSLTTLWCNGNRLTTLDVSNNAALSELYCYENQLTSLDVSKNTALTTLWCHENQLAALDTSKNAALTGLRCEWNRIATLDVSRNTALDWLLCFANQLTALDVSKNTALTELSCGGNQITVLDVSNNTKLEGLYCDLNQLTALNVSKNTTLKDLSCEKNSYDISLNANRSYDLSKLPGSFDASKAKAWNGCTIQGSVIKVNAGVNKVSYTYDCGNGKTMPVTLNVVGVEAPTTYTVRFNANGGYGSMAAVSNISGLYTLPSCTFEAPSRKQFKGWAVSPNGNVITGNSYNITADTTFYAVWEQQEVTGCCLEVGKTVATHGKEVLIPISISQNPGFAGINVKIDYDKTRLQLIGSDDTAGLDWTVNTGDNAGAVMVSTKNHTKNGEILLLKFKVLEDAPDGFAKVSLFNVDVLTIDEKPISVTVSSGGVEVITRLPGDVTGDGVLDTRDALRLKKHLVGLDAPIVWQNADVTGDNDVTLADLLRLMKYLAGMQVELV